MGALASAGWLPSCIDDATVDIGPVPTELTDAAITGVLWQAAPGRFLLDVPDVARYLVEDGSRVTIEPASDVEPIDVVRFFHMSPLAALLFQRGRLAFHAAAASNSDGAVIIAGDSASGKSALLAALLKRGWKLLSDELTISGADERMVPTFGDVVLWTDTMEGLGLQPTPDIHRHVLDYSDRLAAGPQPLRAVYRLVTHNRDDVECETLTGGDKLQALTTLSYNTQIAGALFDRAEYLRRATALMRNVPLHVVRRPRGRWSLDELAELVERG